MPSTSRLATASVVLAAAAFAGNCDARAQPTIMEHRLVVGVNDALGVTHGEIEAVINRMNAVLQQRNTDDDVACAGVQFRLVDLIAKPDIPRTGELGAVLANARNFNSSINVVIVETSICPPAVNPIGCGQLGREGFNVEFRSDPDRDGTLWAHERGHNVGLRHSNGTPPDPALSDIRRLMNNVINEQSVVVRQAECVAFRAAMFASTVPISGTSGGGAVTPPATPQPNPGSGGGGSAAVGRIVLATLTPRAREVLIDVPAEGTPIERILALSPADIDAIRSALDSENLEIVRRAVNVLGLVGTSDDVARIDRILRRPVRDMLMDLAPAERAQIRSLVAMKVNATGSLSRIAHRTGSIEATRILETSANPETSISLVGSASAPHFRRTAIIELASVGNKEAADALGRVLARNDALRGAGPSMARFSLTPEEVTAIQTLSITAQTIAPTDMRRLLDLQTSTPLRR